MQLTGSASTDHETEQLKHSILVYVLNLQKEAVAKYCELSAYDGLTARLELLDTTQVGPRRTSGAQKKFRWNAELAKQCQQTAADKQAQQDKQKQKQSQQQQKQPMPTRPDDPAKVKVLQDEK